MTSRNNESAGKKYSEIFWWALIGLWFGAWINPTILGDIIGILAGLIIWALFRLASKVTSGAIDKVIVIIREGMIGAVIGLAIGRLVVKNDSVAIVLAVIGIFVRGLWGNESIKIRDDEIPD